MVNKASTSLAWSLLDEPLLGIETDQGHRVHVTLPELLARLSRNEATELTAVQAHQQHPTHAFLVQLAAIAVHRAGLPELPKQATIWRSILVEAAAKDGAGEEAFALVVADLQKPAFMQPPVPEGSLAALKNLHQRPSEELDVLITSKNHDVKVHRVDAPRAEHWLYGLVSLQTSQGFLGAGNYGIARMNGGFSSRPCVAYANDVRAPERFQRDATLLLRARKEITERGFKTEGGAALLWCIPWDGASSLPFSALDPFFIEVCRRVRLAQSKDGQTVAYRGSSRAARVDGSAAAGNTGDAWTPVATGDGRALTMPEAGFTYDRVRSLLFDEDWAHGAAGRRADDNSDAYWLGQVLVRGQGKTGGYHERWLPIPRRVRSLLARPDDRARLAKRAEQWVALAGDVRLKVLKPAVLALLQGGPDKLKFDDDRAAPSLDRFGRAVDGIFFSRLFALAEAEEETSDQAFQKELFELARGEFEKAVEAAPLPAARRYRAIALGERALFGAGRRLLPSAFTREPSAKEGRDDI